jgi:hypothetical protein
MIRAQTVRIKMTKKEAYGIAEEKRQNDESANDARGRLENLVKEPTRRIMPVFESQWRLGELDLDEAEDGEENKKQSKEQGGKVKFADAEEVEEPAVESA